MRILLLASLLLGSASNANFGPDAAQPNHIIFWGKTEAWAAIGVANLSNVEKVAAAWVKKGEQGGWMFLENRG